MAQFDKSARIMGAERAALTAQVMTRYLAGDSIREIANRYGRSYGFTHYIVVESGTPMRPRGGSRPGHRKGLGSNKAHRSEPALTS